MSVILKLRWGVEHEEYSVFIGERFVGYITENGNGGSHPWSVHTPSLDINKPHMGDYTTVREAVKELTDSDHYQYVRDYAEHLSRVGG